MKTTRRQFLKQGLQATTGLAVSSSFCGLVGGCSGSSSKDSSAGGDGSILIPNSSNNQYSFSFSVYSQLQNAGGTIRVTILATSGSKVIDIVRFDSSNAYATSVICPHSSCTVNSYNSISQKFACPCHGSTFNADGSLITGPASQNLDSYTATILTSSIELTVP